MSVFSSANSADDIVESLTAGLDANLAGADVLIGDSSNDKE